MKLRRLSLQIVAGPFFRVSVDVKASAIACARSMTRDTCLKGVGQGARWAGVREIGNQRRISQAPDRLASGALREQRLKKRESADESEIEEHQREVGESQQGLELINPSRSSLFFSSPQVQVIVSTPSGDER